MEPLHEYELEYVKEYRRLLNAYENHMDIHECYERGEIPGWMYLRHFSPRRLNVVKWMNIPEASDILEIGAGCGSFTEGLLPGSKSMVCTDDSDLMCKINLLRNSTKGNLEVYKSITLDRRYDYIVVWGKLPVELDLLKKALNKGGKIYWAVDNPLGIRYMAGYKDDDCKDYYSTFAEDTEGKYTLQQISDITAGYDTHIYYPFPSYDLLTSVYSDEWMPHTGDLERTEYIFRDERLVTFQEGSLANRLNKEGLYRYFSNSYIAVIQGD